MRRFRGNLTLGPNVASLRLAPPSHDKSDFSGSDAAIFQISQADVGRTKTFHQSAQGCSLNSVFLKLCNQANWHLNVYL